MATSIVGNATSAVTGGVTGGVKGATGSAAGWVGVASTIIGAVIPVLGSLVAGFFKSHSPEFYFDNGTDKTNQYFSGTGGNPSWMNDQIDHARKGIIGLYQKGTITSYAGGAALYYMPMYAFDLHFNATKGVETWKGDENLQKLCIALYLQGALPTRDMIWPNRPAYKITEGIKALTSSAMYKQILAQYGMTDPNATSAPATTAAPGTAAAVVEQVATKAKTWLQQYGWVLSIIPFSAIFMLLLGRKRR